MAFHFQVVRALLVIYSIILYCNGIEGRTIFNLSELDEQPDSLIQPAIQNPLMIPTLVSVDKCKDPTKASYLPDREMEGEGCLIVPIRRPATNLSIEETANGRVYHAVARTKSSQRYFGAGTYISVHNPQISGDQYTATRVKIQAGAESIEAGWRVDPTLYGDSKTRLFVRTDAGQAHCFNTLCPGFVLLASEGYLVQPFTQVSVPGGPAYELPVYIAQDDPTGNWNLKVGPNRLLLGYWPPHIFTSLAKIASYIEWGAEAYDSKSIPTAQMGTGKPITHDTGHDAYFKKVQIYVEKGVDFDIEANSDSSYYSVSKFKNIDKDFGVVVVYGGPN